MQRYPQSHARKLCYDTAGFGKSRSGTVLRPHMVSVVQSNELWKSLKLRWVTARVKESTRSTRAVARSGKGTGEVRLWIATPERGMFSPELFLSLLKLIYGRAREGSDTIELMSLAGTIFATRLHTIIPMEGQNHRCEMQRYVANVAITPLYVQETGGGLRGSSARIFRWPQPEAASEFGILRSCALMVSVVGSNVVTLTNTSRFVTSPR
jgi:hypothetical protein